MSVPGRRPSAVNERDPLLRRRRSFEHGLEHPSEEEVLAGGTILGIHNLAIVFPQFIVSHYFPTNK